LSCLHEDNGINLGIRENKEKFEKNKQEGVLAKCDFWNLAMMKKCAF
jgi:hypothetical protein